MVPIVRSLSEVFRRVLGYFGKEKDNVQGPTLLGMETSEHRKVPSAEKINNAAREVEELYEHNKDKKVPDRSPRSHTE